MIVGSTGCMAVAPSGCTPSPTFGQEVLEAVNQDREEAGVASVVWDQGLADQAQAWTEHLMQSGFIYHSGRPGENLAGPWPCFSVADIEAAWMASPPHRETILYSAYTRLGVGIGVNGRGLWATEQFA